MVSSAPGHGVGFTNNADLCQMEQIRRAGGHVHKHSAGQRLCAKQKVK